MGILIGFVGMVKRRRGGRSCRIYRICINRHRATVYTVNIITE